MSHTISSLVSSNQNPTCRVELSNVSYAIGGVTLLDDLSFDANEHRIGVVGRNGSGKSTLARLLCGLIKPSSGALSVAGVDVANDRHSAIRTVGMLFQNPDHQIIFPTVEEELGFGLEQLGMSRVQSRNAALASLASFGAERWASQSVSVLSQGQRHLVCLIAVLLMKPRLIVLDEPYAGLDIPTTLQLTRHLQNIDASVLHISHQPDSLKGYDRVLWLEEGRLLMDGSPDDVLPVFTQRMQEIGRSDALI